MRLRSIELIQSKWNNSLHIYTDGSKSPSGTAAASFFVPHFSIRQSKRLTDHTSSYRAELAAITIALLWVEQLNLHTGVVIFTDSLSALLSMQSMKGDKSDNFINDIKYTYTRLAYRGIQVHLEWIPSHCGIQGNEIADLLAKQALTEEIQINNKLCLSEMKAVLKIELYKSWEETWQNYNKTNVRPFKPTIQHNFESTLFRDCEVIIRRLRLCNIGLNADASKVWVSETTQPGQANKNCKYCNTPETITHYLMECPKYTIERAKLIMESDITSPNEIMKLLKSTESATQRALVRFVRRTRRFECS